MAATFQIGVNVKYAGRFLVAPPSQEDEFWSQSVIFVYEETDSAVIGLVLNKELDRSVSELAEHHGLEFNSDEMIFQGGPLNSSALVMLHTDDWSCTNTMQVPGGLRISSDRTMLNRLCSGDTPEKWKLFLGMSGWTSKQLEAEINGKPPYLKKNSWLVASTLDNSLIFNTNPPEMWKSALNTAVREATESYFHID